MTTNFLAAVQSQLPITAAMGGAFDGAEQLMQQFSSFGQQQQQPQQLPQQQQQQQQSNMNLLSGLSNQLGSIPSSVVPGSVPNQMGNLGAFGVSAFGTGQQSLDTRAQFPSVSVPQQQQQPFSSFSNGFAGSAGANAFSNQQQVSSNFLGLSTTG